MDDTSEAGQIDNECLAFRLVRPDWVKTELSPPRPSSQAFQDRPETGAMSVYLDDEIETAGQTVAELHKLWEGYWIFQLTVGQLREEFGQVVTRDPQADFPGHALVRDSGGKRTASKRSRMAQMCTLTRGPGEEATTDAPSDSLESHDAESVTNPWWQLWRRVTRLIRRIFRLLRSSSRNRTGRVGPGDG